MLKDKQEMVLITPIKEKLINRFHQEICDRGENLYYKDIVEIINEEYESEIIKIYKMGYSDAIDECKKMLTEHQKRMNNKCDGCFGAGIDYEEEENE